MNQLEEFERAAAATHTYTDGQIEAMFLGLHVQSEGDIVRVVRTLRAHRPALEKEIAQKYLSGPETG